LEKVTKNTKLAVFKLSENINRIKVILPEVYYLVSSRETRFLCNIEELYFINFSGFEGRVKEHIVLHFANSIIKDIKGLSELMNLINDITLGGLREDNSYVYRRPVLVASFLNNAYGMIYISVKTERKRRGLAWFFSREYSTSTGRTNNVFKKLESLRNRSEKFPDKLIDRSLYRDFLLDPRMYLAAYQKLKSKPGSMTPGISPTTLDGMSMDEIFKIIHRLMWEEFQFTPVFIPKTSGKHRPLTIGNPRDKLVLEIIRLVLEAIYEPLFLQCSHGFRPGKSCHTALRDIFTKFVGCTWWIEGDFESCFDSIDHNKLLNLLSLKIQDQRFLQLIRKSLNAGYFDFKIRKTNIVGVPQGNIISPILVNIFLHELDKFVIDLKTKFDAPESSTKRSRTSEYWKAQYQVRKGKKDNISKKELKELVKQLQNTQSKRLDESTRKLMYIRYADDWIIAINGSHKEAVDILNKVRSFCSNLGLTLSSTNTKITNSYKDYILFLGTRIKHSKITTWSRHKIGYRQRNRRALLLTAPLANIKKKLSLAGFVKNNKGVSRVNWTPLTLRQIIHSYNYLLYGYSNYYSFIINRGKVMSWLFYVMRDSAARTIAHKLSLGRRVKVYKKFGTMLSVLDYEKRQKDSKPTKIAQLFKPSYKINAWDFSVAPLYLDITHFYANHVSLANLDNLKCTVCHSSYRIEMHHVRMMKDLSPNFLIN
jgi:nicotine oxidoreductase